MAVQYRISGDTATAISASIETGIREGVLKPGEPLPSVRALAERLDKSPATVAAAYAELRRRGIVVTNGRNGTRVREATPIAAAMRSTRVVPIREGMRDLASGGPDRTLLPPLSRVSYPDGGPLPELIAAAKRRLRALPDASGYTMLNGALDGLDRVLMAHLRPGDKVGVEDPGWAACLDLLAAQGLIAVPMPVDADGPAVDGVKSALAQGVRAVIVTSRAQNPTGAAISAPRAAALRKILKGVLVIEDDHAAELAGVPWHPVVGETAHWAFIRSASKPYGPDLRCAVLAGDQETVSRVEGRMRLTAGWVSTILQRTLLDLWENFDVGPARSAYDSRRGALIAALAARGVAASGRTGINVWVPVPDETAAVASLRDLGYAVAPGHTFRIASPPAIRVTAATLDLSEVDALADAITAAAGQNRLRAMVGR